MGVTQLPDSNEESSVTVTMREGFLDAGYSTKAGGDSVLSPALRKALRKQPKQPRLKRWYLPNVYGSQR